MNVCVRISFFLFFFAWRALGTQDIFKIGLEELWQYVDFVKKVCRRSRSSLSEIERDLHNVIKSMPGR